ncbi:hypothetical protein CEXT_383241 [Caerostris extrusa]|uniref:Uncharacterized protein n=1 Tax=Caerostris extrusa TaxID=172846 RepID=A0AAV4NNN1_CAEEX|nr:hypothetical protein CEXT_383241 [Caerostris extrusa]
MKYPGTTGSLKSVVPFGSFVVAKIDLAFQYNPACTQTAKSKSVPHNCFKVWPNLRHEISRDAWIPKSVDPFGKSFLIPIQSLVRLRETAASDISITMGDFEDDCSVSYVFLSIQEE